MSQGDEVTAVTLHRLIERHGYPAICPPDAGSKRAYPVSSPLHLHGHSPFSSGAQLEAMYLSAAADIRLYIDYSLSSSIG